MLRNLCGPRVACATCAAAVAVLLLAAPAGAAIAVGDPSSAAAADLYVFQVDRPDPVALGGELTYEIDVHNLGPDEATGVVLTDALPAGTTFVSATTSAGSCSHAAGTVTCELGALPGRYARVEVVVTAPSEPATIVNQVQVSSTTDDPNPDNNVHSATTDVVEPAADLSVFQSDSPDPASLGAAVHYWVSVSNAGPTRATGVVLTDTLPAGATFVSAQAFPGSCGESGGVVTCELGSLDRFASRSVEIVVTAPAQPATLVNHASVAASEPDPNPGNNTDGEETIVDFLADLGVTQADSPDPALPGAAVTYELGVANAGPHDATGVTVTDDLPAGSAFVSATPSQGTCAQGSGTVTCSLGTLPSGGEAAIAVVVTVPPTPGPITNVAVVSADQRDPASWNDQAQEQTRVSAIVPTADACELAQAIASGAAAVVGCAFETVPPSGTPNGSSSLPLASFPTDGARFALLTTGDATAADQEGTHASASSGGGAVRGDTDRDVTVLRIDLDVPVTANCLSIDFRFLSEEYPSFVGSGYNDAFVAELDVSTWTTAGSTISAPDNFAFDPAGNPVSINATGATGMSAAEAAGTAYGGATPLLNAATPVTPGLHSLYLSVFDQGDSSYDSAVMLDALRLSMVPAGACTQGATVLRTAKTADQAVSAPGAANGYTISIANPHTAPYTIQAITDDLPAGFTYRAGSTTGATTADPVVTGGRLRWEGPFTLPAGETLSLHFGVTVASVPGDYLNQAGAEGGDVAVAPTGPVAGVTVLPALSIGDATVAEGDAGTTAATFEVALSGPSETQVTVDYATADGTATAPADYLPASGTLTFLPGETQKTIAVAVVGDTAPEPDETFFVDLSSPAGAALGKARGAGTIVDDDDDGGGGGDGNRPPVAVGGSVTTDEGVPVAVTLQASDPDGDALTYAIVTGPASGALTGSGASRTYAPAAGFFGTDSFTFRVSDGQAESNVATVSITVRRLNRAPVALGASVTTERNVPVTVTLAASDPDGDALAYTIVSPPANGTLGGGGATRTYTPAAGYAGPDSFTFRVGDGQLESNVATVSISVVAPFQPPAQPVPQKAAAARVKKGTVTVQLTKGGPFVPLVGTQVVPFGAVIDTTKGVLLLTVAKDRQGGTWMLEVTGGLFVARQNGKFLTTLTLVGGNFGVCGARRLSASSPPKRGGKSVRRLWGTGTGKFRTKGRYSTATIRGTRWLTDDRCGGTLTFVAQGSVAVRDLPKRRTVVVRKGKSYLAAP